MAMGELADVGEPIDWAESALRQFEAQVSAREAEEYEHRRDVASIARGDRATRTEY